MKTIYLIRHSETEYNKTGKLIGGRSNHIDITEKGVEQAELLGEYLKTKGIIFDKVFASIAVRAIKTAEITLEKIGISKHTIIPRDDILELSQGDWEGMPRDEIYTPELMEKKVKADNWNFSAPNGESQRDVEIRMLNFFKENILDNEDGIYAVFTHGLAIKCFLRGILDSNPKLTYYINIDNTSLTKMRFEKGNLYIDFINATPHLQ